MLNYLITAIIGIIALFGLTTPSSQIWDKLPNNFGATNFPTSLDTLTNPAATDSVATVSHSSQHSNANDALEAIEAKLGTGASTAIINSLFVGTGAGTSAFSTYATATNLTLSGTATVSGLGTFGSLVSQASSTIVGGLTITGNSTSTNATSTIGAFTSYATSTSWFGGGLGTCAGGSSAIQWSGGIFSCGTIVVSAVIPATYATSSGTTSYKIEYVDMTVGDKMLAWASCDRTAENNALALKVRPTNHSTTSLSTAATDMDGVFGMWTATTTYTLAVEASAAACDAGDGLQLMTLLINN